MCSSRLPGSVGLFSCIMVLLATGCAVRNAEYDQLIANGDYGQAKELIRLLQDELSYRDENPSMPARRAQLYYWLANAHGKLAEYDSLKLALSLSVSNDPGFEEARTALLREYSLHEYNRGVSRYNDAEYVEAIAAWENALNLAESQQSAYAGLIHRHFGFAQVRRNDGERALRSLTRAADLNDNVSRELLRGFEANGTLEVPDVIQKIHHTDFESSPSSPPQQPTEESTTDHSSAEIDEAVREKRSVVPFTLKGNTTISLAG